jgi:hypothetical protein
MTYTGLDVHKDGIVLAVAKGGLRSEVRDYGRIANTPAASQRLVRRLGRCGSAIKRGRAVTDPTSVVCEWARLSLLLLP